MEKSEKSVSIRFPVDLLEDMRKIARENNRSLNGEVLTALRAHVERTKKRKKGQSQDD